MHLHEKEGIGGGDTRGWQHQQLRVRGGVTIFTSIKIADKLDKDFLEDLAINQAAREAEEDDEGDYVISLDEIVQEPLLPRTRNRPKREV
ncbi:uncharacterized protein LOC120139711 [Hibiscus syriacus]|uniref:uncharacterized protein LOC120139711 n=1 Tax=Hibiscus syriacus TaxID=106335 RepID=UPI0019241F32|nr:uncharacterized protein LOC120139711 [Hibiscus syriacus]